VKLVTECVAWHKKNPMKHNWSRRFIETKHLKEAVTAIFQETGGDSKLADIPSAVLTPLPASTYKPSPAE